MTAGAVAARLAELGLAVPPPPVPAGAYRPAVLVDGWVYTAGQLPLVDGALLATGHVGAPDGVDAEQAAACARQCALNALAAVSTVADLDRISQVVKVTGFVASAAGFTGQPAVLNGASELLVAVFGDPGRHARSAVGVAELPLGAPVEVELVVRLQP